MSESSEGRWVTFSWFIHTHIAEQLGQAHMCYIQKARGGSLSSTRPPNSGYSYVYRKCAKLLFHYLYFVRKALAQLKKQMLGCIDSTELFQQSHWKSISYLRRQIEQDKSRANLFLLKQFVNTY